MAIDACRLVAASQPASAVCCTGGKMRECDKCGYQFEDDSKITKFCPGCGAKLDAVRCPGCGAVQPMDRISCSECGSSLEGAKLTTAAGSTDSPASAASAPDAAPEAKKELTKDNVRKIRKVLSIAPAALLLFFSILSFLFFLGSAYTLHDSVS